MYNGNPFEEIAKALNDKKVNVRAMTLDRPRLEMILELHNAVIEKNNNLLRERYGDNGNIVEVLTRE